MHALVLVGVQDPVAFKLFRVPRTTPRKRRHPARRKGTFVHVFVTTYVRLEQETMPKFDDDYSYSIVLPHDGWCNSPEGCPKQQR